MSGYSSVVERTAELTMFESRQPTRAPMSPATWPKSAQDALQAHDARLVDVRIADANGCGITHTHKFSTRMGPPPCSPPV